MYVWGEGGGGGGRHRGSECVFTYVCISVFMDICMWSYISLHRIKGGKGDYLFVGVATMH